VNGVDRPSPCSVGFPPARRAVRLGICLLPLLAAGCATQPGTSVPQQITVETPGCPAARCELSNDRGAWVLPATPGTVTVLTSSSPLRLSCQGSDGQPATIGSSATAAPPTGKGAVLGGAVGGTAVGVGVGSVVLGFIPALGVIIVASGVAAGAAAGQAAEAQAQALLYPPTLSLPMACGSTLFSLAPAPTFGLQVRTVDAAAARAAGLALPVGTPERGAVLVTAVTAGGPAEVAGLRAGDLLLAANGRDLLDATHLELWLRILAPAQRLVLQLQRDGQPMERSLQRASAP